MAEPTGLRPHTTQGVLSPPCPPKKFSLETGKGVFSSRWGGRGEAAASPSGCLWPTPQSHTPSAHGPLWCPGSLRSPETVWFELRPPEVTSNQNLPPVRRMYP